MWIAHLAVLFGLKSSEKGRTQLQWPQLLFFMFLADIFLILFSILGIETYSLDTQVVSAPYSHSLFTALFSSIIIILYFTLIREDKFQAIMYALLPIIHFVMDLVAYPGLFIFWNKDSTISGLNTFQLFDSIYFEFVLELVITLALFFVFRLKNPHDIGEKSENQSEDKKILPKSEQKLILNKIDAIWLIIIILGAIPVFFGLFL
jgi:cytochrome c biogenesis factor